MRRQGGGVHVYEVFIVKGSLDRGAGPSAYREIFWGKRVKATSRRRALMRCLPEIRRRVLSRMTDPTIKYVSVYVGRKGSVTGAAFRLNPVQVVVSTGRIR